MQHTLRAIALLAVGLSLTGCAEQRVAGPPPAESTAHGSGAESSAPPSPSVGENAVAAPKADEPKRAWVESVRQERWGEAHDRLEALPEAEKERAPVRYVRARVALALGDHASAAKLLDGLEREVPLLTEDIAQYRAEAQLEAGPFAEAAAYFVRSAAPGDLIRAALAYKKAGDFDSARKVVDRAFLIAVRGKKKPEELKARMARAEIRRAQTPADPIALADLRAVALEAPHTSDGRAALAALEEMKRPLSPAEARRVADKLAEEGGAGALEELDRLAKVSTSANAELTHTRAKALYKARRYEDAAAAFRESAKLDAISKKSGRVAEDLYYAAKSLSRKGDDEEAIKLYREIASKHRKSGYAERAQYLVGRLLLQNGQFDEAAAAHASYLALFKKKGAFKEDAVYERALALISAQKPKEARQIFATLASQKKGDESDKLRELEGLAALRAGDRAGAVAIFRDLTTRRPLTYAAQMARARLGELGEAVPPAMTPVVPGGASLPPLELKLPPEVELLVSLGLDGDAERHLSESEARLSRSYAGREGEALCGLYGLLSRAKRRYRVGVRAVSLPVLFRAPSEDERWAWECLYPQPFSGAVASLEETQGLTPGLLHALMRQESAFDPGAISPVKAVGLMQLMPSTAKKVAEEMSMDLSPDKLTSPSVNLRLGAHYIKKLLGMFKGHVVVAAAAYNAGPKAVSRWIEAGKDNDVDLWVARIPYDETRNYVARVSQNLARYQWLSGGAEAVADIPLTIPPGAVAPDDAY